MATEALERAAGGGAELASPQAARTDPLRVLIYWTDIGGGHDAMANAIKGELLLRHGADGVDVQVANGLQVGNPVMHRLMREPFTREMPKLLAASDGMLTNSAGMTTLEGFARGRPVVLYRRPLPGPRVDGAAALHADQVATHATTPQQAVDALRRIERGDDPDLAARVQRARALFDRGEPVADVVGEFAQVGRSLREPIPR